MLLFLIHLINSVFVVFIGHDAIAISHIVFKEYSGDVSTGCLDGIMYSFSQMK